MIASALCTTTASASLVPQPRTGTYTWQTATSYGNGQAPTTTTFAAASVDAGEPFSVETSTSETYTTHEEEYLAGPDGSCATRDFPGDAEAVDEVYLHKVGPGGTFVDEGTRPIGIRAAGTRRDGLEETASRRTDEFGYTWCSRHQGRSESHMIARVRGAATTRLRGCFQASPIRASEAGPTYGEVDWRSYTQYSGTVATIRIGLSATEPCPIGADEPAGGDAGLVCGKAKFRFYHVTGQKAFVRKGERACVLAVSNRMTREASDRGGKLTAAIVSAFGEQLAEHLAGEVEETAAQKKLKRQGKKLLKKLLPGLAAGIKAGTRVDVIGDAALALMLPYAAGKHLQHVTAYNGCTRLLVDVDKGKLKVAGGLLYSPKGLHDPKKNRYLTHLSVYEKIRKRLRFDENERRMSSLHCNGDGMIESNGTDRGLFGNPEQIMLNGDDF